jgi:hypothetical protein
VDSTYFDDIVQRAGEKVSRRSVLLSAVGGSLLCLVRRPTRHGPGPPHPGIAASTARGLCPNDPVTQKSLAAAKRELAAGKTKVNLSPKGCLTYSKAAKAKVTTETIAAHGVPVMITTRQPGRLTQKLDADLDGYFELDRVVTDSNGTVVSTQTQHDSKSKAVVARQQATQRGSVTTVSSFEAVGGTLQQVGMFTTHGPDIDEHAPADAASPVTPAAAAGCSAAQLAELKMTFDTAIRTGLECMRHFDATEILLDVMFSYVARDLVFGCIASCPSGQHCVGTTPSSSISNPANPVQINLPPIFFSDTLSDYDREAVLWHEFLHSALGYFHDPNDLDSSRRFERDRIYACETLCFSRNYDTRDSEPTRCSCAVCLKTTSCDKRCDLYKDCDPTFYFACPCPKGPNAFKQFRTCSKCVTVCPTGLNCFGYSTCIPKSVGCEAVHCP